MLNIKNLVVKYGLATALKGVDLTIQKGKITAILGNNGAGKSTLLKAISGIQPPFRGSEILFDGKSIVGTTPVSIVKSGICMVPEGRQVFGKLTVTENMNMGAYLMKDSKKIEENRAMCFDLFPRLKEREKQMAGTLSGGEQQMLAIARALMGSPKLLMLDEPSLGLAPVVVEKIYENLLEINKTGLTLIVVEQNANIALEVCDYAYTITNGEVATSGTKEELLQDNSFIKAYLGGS